MQYREEIANRLRVVVQALREIDDISRNTPSHRLDYLEPVQLKFAGILSDLERDTGLGAATAKVAELNARLSHGFSRLADPRYRSLLASLLGSYQRDGGPTTAHLGGLKGGRPRKDRKPVMTLERKGYTAQTMPGKKPKGLRSHPSLRPASQSVSPRR
jgi:hypothetical protein